LHRLPYVPQSWLVPSSQKSFTSVPNTGYNCFIAKKLQCTFDVL
jgi:hypothetical protein